MTAMLSTVITQELEVALRGLRYGSIQLVVHDGNVVRIERVERIRLTNPSEAASTVSGKPTPSTEDCLHVQQEG